MQLGSAWKPTAPQARSPFLPKKKQPNLTPKNSLPGATVGTCILKLAESTRFPRSYGCCSIGTAKRSMISGGTSSAREVHSKDCLFEGFQFGRLLSGCLLRNIGLTRCTEARKDSRRRRNCGSNRNGFQKVAYSARSLSRRAKP